MRKYLLSIFILIGAASLGVVGGSHLAKHRLAQSLDLFPDARGPWMYTAIVGSQEASSLDRARLAQTGPLGLQYPEVAYFLAVVDGEGEALTSNCQYRISGGVIPTRWWSITVYDGETNNYVSPLPDRASWSSRELALDEDQQWEFALSSTPIGELAQLDPGESNRPLEILLRLYNPDIEALPGAELPKIVRASC